MKPFGQLCGRTARLYTLQSEFLQAAVMDYGGALVSLDCLDAAGKSVGIVLGFDGVEAYAEAGGSFGALLGRNANRISGGSVRIGDRTCKLSQNENGVTLHGGKTGFGNRYWEVVSHSASELRLMLKSEDGDQGFPGMVEVTATYGLEGHDLSLTFEATSTASTILSLSSHPYFNLNGQISAQGCVDHEIGIAAEHFLPTDDRQIPTGEIRCVAGTEFDFRGLRVVGEGICTPDPQLRIGKGYDHYFVLAREPSDTPSLAARARSPRSGITLELLTTQRGLQFYTGNNLDGSIMGRGGLFRQSAGFALEPQGFPDAPHHATFPSNLLGPDQLYRQVSVYRVSSGSSAFDRG
jgi:aldose 1-epimerase